MPRPSFLLLSTAVVALTLPLAAQPAAKASATESDSSSWQSAITARRQQLIQQNGPGTDVPLRDQLLKMRDTDQAARGFSSGRQKTAGMTPEMVAKLPAVDTELTVELKQIVARKGWPTISLVGLDASDAAMLILTHTRDHAWQGTLLPQLAQLADTGKIDASNLALVIDKELVSEGKLQRYGTQFKVVNGEMAMYGVEDPGGLDRLRARALLPPMSVYKETLSQIYHLKTSNAIVSATPPAEKKN